MTHVTRLRVTPDCYYFAPFGLDGFGTIFFFLFLLFLFSPCPHFDSCILFTRCIVMEPKLDRCVPFKTTPKT